MINYKNIKTIFAKKNAVIILVAIASLISFSFSTFLIFNNKSNESIVIFDKESLFNDYYHSISSLSNKTSDPDLLKQLLEKKNAFFIKALTSDLNTYQQTHNVIIIKRAALAAPEVILGSHKDITSSIEHELIVQGAISQGVIS